MLNSTARRPQRTRRATTASPPDPYLEGPLPAYLREMGSIDRIDDEQEISLSTQIEDARARLVRSLKKLPARIRKIVLVEESDGRRRRDPWSLDRLEAICARVRRLPRDPGDGATSTLRRQIAIEHRRMTAARDRMITANLRLVVHIAKQ